MTAWSRIGAMARDRAWLAVIPAVVLIAIAVLPLSSRQTRLRKARRRRQNPPIAQTQAAVVTALPGAHGGASDAVAADAHVATGAPPVTQAHTPVSGDAALAPVRRRRLTVHRRWAVALPAALVLVVAASGWEAAAQGTPADGGLHSGGDWAMVVGATAESDARTAGMSGTTPNPTPTPTPVPTPTPTSTPPPTPEPTATPTPTPAPTATPRPQIALTTGPANGKLATLYRRGSTSAKVIAITIDDCFSNSAVLADLAILQRYKANATWFPIGHVVESNPDTWRTVAAAGYPIANHTYSHSNLTLWPYELMVSDIARDNAVVSAIIGEPLLPIVRPMGGSWNNTVLKAAAAAGEQAVALWDVTDGDTAAMPGRANIATLVANATQGGPGSIILMHANLPYAQQALPQIIEYYLSRGYTFVTLGQLFGIDGRVPYP